MELDKLANQNPWWVDSTAIAKDKKPGKLADKLECVYLQIR